jgi:hypothetical protein
MERFMVRILMAALLAAGLFALSPSAKTFAQEKQTKKSTCEFGADDQKLKGAERKKFLAKCMANEDAGDKKSKPKPKPKKKEEKKEG